MMHGHGNLDGGEKDYDFEKGCPKDKGGMGATIPQGGYDWEKGCAREGHGMGLEGDYDSERGRAK